MQLQCSTVLLSLLRAPVLPVIFETGLPSVDHVVSFRDAGDWNLHHRWTAYYNHHLFWWWNYRLILWHWLLKDGNHHRDRHWLFLLEIIKMFLASQKLDWSNVQNGQSTVDSLDPYQLGQFQKPQVFDDYMGSYITQIYITQDFQIPVVPHKAMAEVSKMGNL